MKRRVARNKLAAMRIAESLKQTPCETHLRAQTEESPS